MSDKKVTPKDPETVPVAQADDDTIVRSTSRKAGRKELRKELRKAGRKMSRKAGRVHGI